LLSKNAAVALSFESAWGYLDEASFTRLVELHADKRQSTEAAEGLASFKEKRPAKWA
jgi:methylglutaconyl-CoA hydratase